MTVRRSLVLQFFVLLAVVLFSAYMAPRMPATVPTHWNASGHADGFGSKWINLLLGPCLVIFGMILTFALPLLSPKNFDISKFASTYGSIMLVMSALFAYLHVVIVFASAGESSMMPRFLMAGIFGFFSLMGRFMGGIKKNFFVGIRTPWTLSNDRVWEETHKHAGKLWMYGGLVGAILSIIGLPMFFSAGIILVLALIPVLDSFMLYRRIA